MRIQIDVDRSIKKGRLKVINKSFDQSFDAFVFIFLSVLLILVGVIFPAVSTIKSIIEGEQEVVKPLIIFSPFIFMGMLSLYALCNDNRLTKFESIDEEKDRKLVVEVLKSKFGALAIYNGGEILSIYKRASLWKFGTRVIVIFRGNNVYINISRFNDRGLKSPFHLWFDSFKIRSIIREINNKTQHNKAQALYSASSIACTSTLGEIE